MGRTPSKKQPAATASIATEPKTPKKRDSSRSNVGPKTPSKKEAITPHKKEVKGSSGEPRTPGKAKPMSSDRKEPKTPSKAASVGSIPTKKDPKTPKKSDPRTPRKREASVSDLNKKEPKKAKQERSIKNKSDVINVSDSDESIILVDDPSLTPCKVCPLTFSFKREYREHLKKHKEETSAKIENTKKEIEELQMNLNPTKSKKQTTPKTLAKNKYYEKFPIAIPFDDSVDDSFDDFVDDSVNEKVEKRKNGGTIKHLKKEIKHLKKEITSVSLTKKSPRLAAAKDKRWQCGLSDGTGSRCKEIFDVRRGLRYHMANDHGKRRTGGS